VGEEGGALLLRKIFIHRVTTRCAYWTFWRARDGG